MLELIALFLVGLSLFFHGIGGIRTHLQGLTSRRLRQQLARWSKHPVIAGIWGFVFGAVTQSSTAVAFILTSLVSGGLMTVPRALPIVAWANLGTVVLVLFVSFDVHLAFLYVLGLTGVALAFNLGSARVRPVLATLFSVGLLFFGLHLMKDAFAPLPRFSWFNDLAAFIHGSAFATFVTGALLRVPLQSSSGIAVIAIALAHGGLLSADQAAMMMYGTGVGVGLSVFLLSANLRGIARQLALYQALINGFSGLTLCALFYLETLTGWPLALHLARSFAATESLQLACAFLALQSTAVIVALLGSRFAARWLEKISPATDEQDLSRPRYLTEQALADAESALDLAEKEQLHLFGHLPAQLDTIRAETAATTRVPAAALHQAGAAVGAELQAFLRELVEQQSDRTTSARLLLLEQRQTTLVALNEAVHHFTETFAKLRAAETSPDMPNGFLHNLVESLNTLLLTAADALRSGDAVDRDLLLGLTRDRGDLMERLRRTLLDNSHASPAHHQQKANLLYLTSLFERSVWLLRQLALADGNLDPAPRGDTQL
jgi:phosphate:Na+ symporter